MSIRHYSHLQKFTFTFLMLLSATIVFNNVWIPDRLDSLQHRKQDRYNFHMAYSFFVDTKLRGFVGDKEYINYEFFGTRLEGFTSLQIVTPCVTVVA